MDRSYGESPSMPTPQDPAKWTGAMGKAPAWRRSRTHLDGQELWESPNMPTPQDPAKWKGAMGEARHADAPGPTKMDRSYGGRPITRTSAGRQPNITQAWGNLPHKPCLHPRDILKTNQSGPELPL